jgi:hypothetical protein
MLLDLGARGRIAEGSRQNSETGAALNAAFNIVFTISLIGIAMLIFEKARSSAHLRQRAITPLAVVFIANIAEFVIALFVAPRLSGGERDAQDRPTGSSRWACRSRFSSARFEGTSSRRSASGRSRFARAESR